MKKAQVGVVLVRSGGTTFYQSQSPGPGETMLFLLWNTTSPPATIPLEQTWSSSGVPASLGYFLFLNKIPDASVLAAFEASIRKDLATPAATSFAWVIYALGKPPVISTLLPVGPNASKAPVVAQDVPLALPPGMEGLGLAQNAPVLASENADFLTGFTITYPPLAGSDPPSAQGIDLPMTGAAVGAIRFAGLVNAGPVKVQDKALKSLVLVQIDPLRPVDPKRTFQTITGIQYTLTQVGATYQIVRSGSAK